MESSFSINPIFRPLQIYTGTLTIENNEVNLIEIAIAADELQLLEVYQQLENLLLENKLAWKPKDIITALQNERFTNLYNYALGILPDGLDEEVLQHFMEPNSKTSFDILPLRGYPFDSNIINAKDAALIAIEEDETSPLLPMNNEFYNDFKCKASNSFIFSLTNRGNPILSRVFSKEEAIIWCRNKGPCFGLQDLRINHVGIICESRQQSYENKIINRGTFEIEEYEVFLIDKGFSKH
ncbi:30180_t:CDS:2, partial [Gigaspora margarita]